MYVVDPLQYAANVNVAKGQLAEAEANLARAEQDVARYTPLVEQNAISRQEYETAVQMAKASRASVQAMRGSVQKAQVELGYCTVTSPIDGLAGSSSVEVGDLIGRIAAGPLTTVSKLDPIRVKFSMSEVEWLRVTKRRRQLDSSARKRPIPLQLILADKSVHPYLKAWFVLVNSHVFAQRLIKRVEQLLFLSGQCPSFRAHSMSLWWMPNRRQFRCVQW